MPTALSNFIHFELAQLAPSTRLREDYGDVAELALSLTEKGQLQPIVINQDNVLIAGGRRVKAALSVGMTHLYAVYKETLDESHLRELELEENIRRKDMTWQERTLGTLEIHMLKSRQSALEGALWTRQDTGDFLGGVSRATVDQALPVAREIRANPTGAVAKAQDFTTAFKTLMAMREMEAKALLIAKATGSSLLFGGGAPSSKLSHSLNISDPSALTTPAADSTNAVPPPQEVTLNLATYARSGNSLDILASAQPSSVDHILTDPPYAIDMSNLQQQNTGMDVSSTANEHGVDSNLELLRRFIPLAYRVLRDKGFCVLFCDPLHFTYLVDLGTSAGFTVCRWPVVWCKTVALNQAAGYNFTKATEFAVVMRKGNATLVEHQALNYRIIGNDKGEFDHPFAKPLGLWQWFITAISLPGQTLLDPFGGGGSGPCAFIDSGRQWRTIELTDLHFQDLLKHTAKTLARHFPNIKFNFTYDPDLAGPFLAPQ